MRPPSPMFLDSALPIHEEPRTLTVDERVSRAWARFEREYELPYRRSTCARRSWPAGARAAPTCCAVPRGSPSSCRRCAK